LTGCGITQRFGRCAFYTASADDKSICPQLRFLVQFINNNPNNTTTHYPSPRNMKNKFLLKSSRHSLLAATVGALVFQLTLCSSFADAPVATTTVAVGDVDQTSAVVWAHC
jgi:hypothetical protein